MEKTFYPKEFQWDGWNTKKNWQKHKVTTSECEEVFFNESLIITGIDKSKILYREDRYTAYGITNTCRLLFVIFTIRENKIRVISARDMSRSERRFYHEEAKKSDSIQK